MYRHNDPWPVGKRKRKRKGGPKKKRHEVGYQVKRDTNKYVCIFPTITLYAFLLNLRLNQLFRFSVATDC